MRYVKLLVCAVLACLLTTSSVFATEGNNSFQPNWIEGGTTVGVGELSTLKLDESLLYLDKENTEQVQQFLGNSVMGTEIGSVFPASEEESWFVLFDYEEVGYISDKEKDKIDAKKLLKSYQDGTAAANEERPVEEQLKVLGWHTEPYYDEQDRTLIWALLAEDYEGNSIINYNVRILTRQGYVSVLLVTDEATLEKDITSLKTLILPNYSISDGFKYEDFDPSVDKKSEFGLTGLILGGAGLVAAKKVGLLAAGLVLLKKFWFILLAIPLAIWRWMKRKANGEDKTEEAEQTYHSSDASGSGSTGQTMDHDQK